MTDERLEVSIARLEGKVEQVATLLEDRSRRLDQDVYTASAKATKAHERIDHEVDALRTELRGDVTKLRDELSTSLTTLSTDLRRDLGGLRTTLDELKLAHASDAGERQGAERSRRRFFQTMGVVVPVLALIVALGQFGLGVFGG